MFFVKSLSEFLNRPASLDELSTFLFIQTVSDPIQVVIYIFHPSINEDFQLSRLGSTIALKIG